MNDDTLICRCEEVTFGDIKDAIRNGATDADAVKRMTRTGMGLCQGKTCGRVIAGILSRQLNIPVQQITEVTTRMPVRPISTSIMSRCADTSQVPRQSPS